MHTLAGEPVCVECALQGLAGVTVALDIGPRLEGDLPAARTPQRATTDRVARRRTTRGRSDRAAMTRLKLAHLPEYNALLVDEMARNGHVPTKPRPLDHYMRMIFSKRLAALAQRMGVDA